MLPSKPSTTPCPTIHPLLRFQHLIPLLLILVLRAHPTTAEGPNCNIPLNLAGGKYPSCISDCLAQSATDSNSFVCDISAEWMHHVGGTSDWYPATPPKGTGVHEYVAFKGDPPCQKNGHCILCDKTQVQGTKVCSVLIDPEDCSVKCPDEKNGGNTTMILGGILLLVVVGGGIYYKKSGTKKQQHFR